MNHTTNEHFLAEIRDLKTQIKLRDNLIVTLKTLIKSLKDSVKMWRNPEKYFNKNSNQIIARREKQFFAMLDKHSDIFERLSKR